MKDEAGHQRFAPVAFVACAPFSMAAIEALRSCAKALGYEGEARFVDVSGYDSQELVLAVHTWDPWSVVAVDETSAVKLAEAFGAEAQGLAPDAPVAVRGYRFVAVPGFEQCLEDKDAKRIAWGRMKAAAHPSAPY